MRENPEKVQSAETAPATPAPEGQAETAVLPVMPPLDGAVTPHSNPVDTYLADKSPHTKRAVRGHMNRVARLFNYPDYQNTPWGAIRFKHVQEVMGYLFEQEYAPQTINGVLAAIRGTAQAAFAMNQMTADDLARIRLIKMARGSRLPTGRLIPLGEISHLVNACTDDPKPSGPRDAAIIGLLYIAGLRRSEVVQLNRADLKLEERELTFIGKGNKERKTFIDAGTASALQDWLISRTDISGPLFVRVLKSGKLDFGALSAQSVYNIVRKRWLQAGIPPVSPHDFRRTFISTLLSKGVDVFTVQRMAGHADPRTTSGYDLRPEEDARAATELLHLPYVCQQKGKKNPL